MKKAIGFFCLLIAVFLVVFPFAAQLRTTYCCSCPADGWKLGFGFNVIYERDHILCSCAAGGCVPAYHLIAIDFLLIALGFGALGIFLVSAKMSKS